jgi:hypothetical protein
MYTLENQNSIQICGSTIEGLAGLGTRRRHQGGRRRSERRLSAVSTTDPRTLRRWKISSPARTIAGAPAPSRA